jgi:UDP:flavonoid glycosyltransferase YjiC (YdhE family)
MAKIMIWPDIYREQGHWLPCISLANTLRSTTGGNHTVEFMGIPDNKFIVEGYGGTFRTILSKIYPVGHSDENKLEPLDQRWKPHHLFPIAKGDADALGTIFTDSATKPDLLVSGYFTGLETLLIHYKYSIPFVLITTYLRHPCDRPCLHAKTKLLYMQKAVSRALIDSVVPEAKKGMSIDEFVKPLSKYPEIIPCPKEFDFTDTDWNWKTQLNVSYVEPMIARSSLGGTTVPADPTAIPSGKKLIFGTSGSQVQDYEFRAFQFFKNLIAMMQTDLMTNYYLVLAVGSKLVSQLNAEYKTSDGKLSNVAWYPWVSQLEVVKQAEVVFMHGGLATIKESIWEQVPIVIVPHGKDQMDNALRIQRAGIGVVSDISELTPTDLRTLLTKATSDTWIKKNLKKMKDAFTTAENTKTSLNAINKALSPTPTV